VTIDLRDRQRERTIDVGVVAQHVDGRLLVLVDRDGVVIGDRRVGTDCTFSTTERLVICVPPAPLLRRHGAISSVSPPKKFGAPVYFRVASVAFDVGDRAGDRAAGTYRCR